MTIEIQVPEVWENRTIHTFVAPERTQEFAGNITVAPFETDERWSLEDFVQNVPLSSMGRDDLLVLDRGFKARGVTRYYERTFRFVEPQQGLLLQQRQRFAMVAKKPHIFTCTDVADHFERSAQSLEDVFDRFLESARAKA
jgi:hypothetical protein